MTYEEYKEWLDMVSLQNSLKVLVDYTNDEKYIKALNDITDKINTKIPEVEKWLQI